ncbi:aryl-sulfate sulfotransferase [bacterium]|nr:aryl-sulfate sulfotransferase [bacterium]
MKAIIRIILIHLFVFLLPVLSFEQENEKRFSEGIQTGISIYKPDQCWNGYTLVPYEDGMILIIDMNGKVVHKWNFGTERATLLPNGNILIIGDPVTGELYKTTEYDWDGKRVWECEVPGGPYFGDTYPTIGMIHHDLQRLENGNTIFLYHDEVPMEYKKLLKDPHKITRKIIGDCVLEVNKEGEAVWEWHLHKHLDLNVSPIIREEKGKVLDWTHTNTVRVLPQNHWYDSGHAEFKPGNVIICPRHLDVIYIIDRETKEIVWSYEGEYMGGLAHPHEPYMIKKGLPGAGNILIFDNGTGPKTRECNGTALRDEMTIILEINPVTKSPVWLYQNTKEFFSKIQGTQQRLANGNTFICESTKGRIFEVKRDGEIVWEYVMPPFPGSDAEHGFGTRPHRYSYDYCPQLKALYNEK